MCCNGNFISLETLLKQIDEYIRTDLVFQSICQKGLKGVIKTHSCVYMLSTWIFYIPRNVKLSHCLKYLLRDWHYLAEYRILASDEYIYNMSWMNRIINGKVGDS